MDLNKLTIHELHEKLKAGKATSRQAVEAVYARIDKVEPTVRAYLTLMKDEALRQADEADARYRKGDFRGPLDGAPIGLKDIFLTAGVRTTCASRILENFIAPYDAGVVERLRAAGAVFPGKLNMDEFAMGSSTENSAFQATHNPWNTDHIPGGSSGGSAAAVAAHECAAALGTDTGGSIRQPASHCGIVGLKPTYGRVSRYGVIAFASSLDQVGPMTKDVRDCAILLQAIAGHDKRDSTSSTAPVPDYPALLTGEVKGLRVGLPAEYFAAGLDPEVKGLVEKAAGALKAAGAKLVKVSLPGTRYAVATYYVIAPAEASSNLARYDGVRFGLRDREAKSLIEMYRKTRSRGFGPEVKRRIMLGTFALSAGYYDAYYGRAQRVRTVIKREMEEAFKAADVLLTPVAPTAAFALGEKSGDPMQMYLSDVFTIPVNIAGIAGISVPCGLTKDKLPVGVQLISPPFKEDLLLNVAYAYERARGPSPACPLK